MENVCGITSGQIKAARALLNWSQEELAGNASLSVATIRKLELGHISPRHSTTSVIRRAIENAGLEFMDSDGVRRRHKSVAVYEGTDGIDGFFEDIRRTLGRMGGNAGGDLSIVASPALQSVLGGNEDYNRRLQEILRANAVAHIKYLISGNGQARPVLPRLECRALSTHYIDPVPFYIYGNKYALVTPEAGRARIIVVHSASTAEASRRCFQSMWEKGMTLL